MAWGWLELPYRREDHGHKIFKSDGQGGSTTTSQSSITREIAYINARMLSISVWLRFQWCRGRHFGRGSGERGGFNRALVTVVVIGNADNGANGQNVDGSTLPPYPAICLGGRRDRRGIVDATTGQKELLQSLQHTYAEIERQGPSLLQGTFDPPFRKSFSLTRA